MCCALTIGIVYGRFSSFTRPLPLPCVTQRVSHVASEYATFPFGAPEQPLVFDGIRVAQFSFLCLFRLKVLCLWHFYYSWTTWFSLYIDLWFCFNHSLLMGFSILCLFRLIFMCLCNFYYFCVKCLSLHVYIFCFIYWYLLSSFTHITQLLIDLLLYNTHMFWTGPK